MNKIEDKTGDKSKKWTELYKNIGKHEQNYRKQVNPSPIEPNTTKMVASKIVQQQNKSSKKRKKPIEMKNG